MSETARLTIKLKLPVVSKGFSAKYSVVRKPTGVEYMLLTTIGMKSLRDKTWREVMDIYGIPEIVFDQVYRPALENMCWGPGGADSHMITLRQDPDIDNPVSDAEFTTAGRQAFDKGVIADKIEEIRGIMAYVPAQLNKKYLKDERITRCSPDGFHADLFRDIQPDDQRIENALIMDKGDFAVPKDADIFDVNIDADIHMSCYSKDISLNFDQVTGTFSLNPGDLDESFLKGRFTSEDLVDLIDGGAYRSADSGLTFQDVRADMPEWDRYSVHLPSEVNVQKSRLVLVGGEFVTSQKYDTLRGDQGCDILAIETSKLGYEYCLVNKDVPVSGFEGTGNCNLMVRRSIDEGRIKEIVKQAVGEVDITTYSGFKKALGIMSITDDSEDILELVKRYLTASSDICADILALQEYRKMRWYAELSDVIEEVIAGRRLGPKEAASILAETKTVVTGNILTESMKTGDARSNLMVAEALYPNVRNPAPMVKALDIGDQLTNDILDGTCGSFVSKPFAAASNLSYNIQTMKAILRIKSPSSMEMDIDGISEKDRETVMSRGPVMRRDLEAVAPFIRGADRFREVEFYVDISAEIASVLKSMVQVKVQENAPDRIFGITLGITLEEALKTLVGAQDLVDMITNSHERGLISDRDYETLEEIRRFRNKCAHDPVIPSVDRKTRKMWMATVDNLKPALSKEGSR